MKKNRLVTISILTALMFSACGNTNSTQYSNMASADTSTAVQVSSDSSESSENETSSANKSEKDTESFVSSKSKTHKITVVSSNSKPESKSESETESQKDGKEVHIGDNITTDFCEMSIESYKISKTFDYTMKNWNGDTVPVSIDAGEGKTYLIFTGIYKNTSGDELSPTISAGDVLVNDKYNYSYLFWENDNITNDGVIRYIGGLDPLESNRYYGMIILPDETANMLTKCEIGFTVHGGKSSDYKMEEYRLIISQ